MPSLTYAGGRGGGRSSGISRSSGAPHSSAGTLRSNSGSSRISAPAPGTGSKVSSSSVGSYIKRDGTPVNSYRRTTGDTKFENNYSTKGNSSPYSGKDGTKVTPPVKR